MAARERSYRCAVCRWQGMAEPIDVGDAAPCPECGVYLYPQTWASTWGFALLLIAASLGVVAVAALLLR
ncbi:MAG: hypothetical protein L0241_22330 [Planctomycetia bacterium]|nr:hypothetical protein [Planctomycetia bacterium]